MSPSSRAAFAAASAAAVIAWLISREKTAVEISAETSGGPPSLGARVGAGARVEPGAVVSFGVEVPPDGRVPRFARWTRAPVADDGFGDGFGDAAAFDAAPGSGENGGFRRDRWYSCGKCKSRGGKDTTNYDPVEGTAPLEAG